jgi:hypothetical protein
MENHELNSPIRYIYCLVDKPNNRFKLGSTEHAHYAPSMMFAYDPVESFQAGYVEEYAMLGERILLEQNAAHVLPGQGGELAESGAWLHMACFEVVRAVLSQAQHVVAPISLALTSPEALAIMTPEQLDRLHKNLTSTIGGLIEANSRKP